MMRMGTITGDREGGFNTKARRTRRNTKEHEEEEMMNEEEEGRG